ncbi:MAG: thymidine kinase [Alphaproteobacteria bacterium]
MASLYFKFAAMNSGKSTQLLQAHYNYFERGMNPMALTAKLDDRFGDGKITARIGLDLHAETFDAQTDVLALVQKAHEDKKVDCVLVDEAQFLTPEQVIACTQIVDDLGIPVMCYGLKTDFMGKLFPGSEALLRFADNLEEIKTICWCGRKATLTARVTSKGDVVREGAQVAIGGNDMYISLCRKHFLRGEPAAQKSADAKDKAAA